jgi:hypothetical protein
MARIPCTMNHEASTMKNVKFYQHQQFDPSENLLVQDCFHMMTTIAENVVILHHTHPSETARYFIIVNPQTGESMKVVFEKPEAQPTWEEVIEKIEQCSAP